MLKIIIVLLFIGVVVSLFSGLNFLVKDLGNPRKRLLYALGVRVSLVALLLATITYGFVSGQLNSTAPWDRTLHPTQSGSVK
ncbi:DUF2909 domain-containing protein [Gammaproteobacteria bacterium LSUCC0057]|uniref:DUF2909 domain-containing protein n=1 Tax=Gammaproteobacteria bacterium LSUCC0057 TaxID=2559237 RepID=A0A4Y8UGW6_9GAMM|nr:DUF2909 domain-containing protein [Gammaproteobacteria bacterium LSUCC0057]